MYRIPLTNSPNQVFSCSVPFNEKNVEFKFELRYNYIAEYWSLTLSDVKKEKVIFSNLPLLVSEYDFSNLFSQLGYLNIGACFIIPKIEETKSMPNNEELGDSYIMIWGDNE